MTPATIKKLRGLLEEARVNRTVTPIKEAIKILDSVPTSGDPASKVATTTPTTTKATAPFGFSRLTHTEGPGFVKRMDSLLRAQG